MRMTLPILIGLLIVTAAVAVADNPGQQALKYELGLMPGQLHNDLMIRDNAGMRADTTWWGGHTWISGEYYASPYLNARVDAVYSFDRGTGPNNPPAPYIHNGQGWKAVDLTANSVQYWRVIDENLDLGEGVVAPLVAGVYSLWFGVNQPEADQLCWQCGAGYGNDYCQRVTSPNIAYNGTANISLEMLYWNDNEECYDGTTIYLKRADSVELSMNQHTGGCPANPGWETQGKGFTGRIGVDTLTWTVVPELWVSPSYGTAEIGAAQNINFIIEFISDGGLSNEDCRGDFLLGGFACDNIEYKVNGAVSQSWNFEDNTLQGWTRGFCLPVGAYGGIWDLSLFEILDPCACRLENNILALAVEEQGEWVHPYGQHVNLMGPICNFANTDLKTIFMEFDMYAEMPRENGVLIRPCWQYYPYLCEITQTIQWSPIVGQDAFNYFGTDPVCSTWRYGATTVNSGVPVPNSAEQVIPIIELLGNCDTFAITNCSGVTNYTPLFDNIVVGVTGAANAPSISSDNGTLFQDIGSMPSINFDVRAPGPANVTVDKWMDNQAKRDKLGDSLLIIGPDPGTDVNKRWNAKLWWRVARRGAFQSDFAGGSQTAYKTWKDRVADGKLIDRPYRPEFTWGQMDSNQVGVIPQKNRLISHFREDDDDYVAPESNPLNEMLLDDIFYPGTQIQYFITASYNNFPNERYFYPDTLGGNYFEFEILPGVRTANVPNCGGSGFNFCAFHPATLYIDFFNRGSQFFIENALATLLNDKAPCLIEDGCPIPPDRNWDRYDYSDGSSNWNAPFARGLVAGSTNGMTLNQILGYRTIIGNTGTYSEGATQEEDYLLFDQWLTEPNCGANQNSQLFVYNGDKCGEILMALPTFGVPFLNNTLGAQLLCDAFNGYTTDPECAPEDNSYCLQLLPVGGGPFGTIVAVDAYGSYCPNLYGFNVYTPINGGVGNRVYTGEDGGKSMQYEQVVRTSGPDYNTHKYKTVIDGVSWHHMTLRDPLGTGEGKCPRDTPDIVAGSLAEIQAAMCWGHNITDPNNYRQLPRLTSAKDLGQCQATWSLPAGVDDAAQGSFVNRLFQNQPNPFNPRTLISFSLAQSGPVDISVFDVNGRLVRKLVDGTKEAGPHSVYWDGTNDQGHRVGSGVYWSQMKVGSWASTKKLLYVK